MKDILGQEIEVGDTVVCGRTGHHPVHGNDMGYLSIGTVESIYSKGTEPSLTVKFMKHGMNTKEKESDGKTFGLVHERIMVIAKANAVASSDPPIDLNGKGIIFTGRLKSMTREEAANAALMKGAWIANAVRQSTIVVVADAAIGSSNIKMKEASRRGANIMSESEFKRAIA